MTVQDVSDSCDALPACRSTQSVHTDSRPFRFFNLPAELRNNVYDLAANGTSPDGRHEIFHVIGHDARTPLQHSWGFIGLTQASHRMREEFRPFYMSKVTLVIILSDLPAFTKTFLANILDRPQSAPGSVEVKPCMRTPKFWRPVKYVDIAPFLRIICACKMSRYVFLARWAGDWLPPFLNAAGTTLTAPWSLALDRHIDRFEMDREPEVGRRQVRIILRPEVQGGIRNDWYMSYHSGLFEADGDETESAVRYLKRLGVQEHGQGYPLRDIWFVKRGNIPVNRAWRRQDRSVEVSLEDCCLYTT